MGASFLNLVATKVTVKGEEQKFVSLCLRQGFNRASHLYRGGELSVA